MTDPSTPLTADDAPLAAHAHAIARHLQARGWRLATAESCTGGWVAKCLTDVPGSSTWFERGYVTYSNQSKHEALGVSAAVIDTFGAVSREVAEQMAAGALHASHVDLALAITGVAGPGGGSADKPVGLVWFALARRGGDCRSEVHRFAGDRAAVRRAAVAQGLALIGLAALDADIG